jgi:hypothetical protein
MKLDFSFDEFEKHESPAMSQPTRDLRDGERRLLLDQVRRLRFGRAQERSMQGGHESNELSKRLRSLEDQLVDHLSCQLGCFALTWPEHRIAVRRVLQVAIALWRDGDLRRPQAESAGGREPPAQDTFPETAAAIPSLSELFEKNALRDFPDRQVLVAPSPANTLMPALQLGYPVDQIEPRDQACN